MLQYLNGHLKIFSDHRSQFWKMIVFFAPLLGAFLITGALVSLLPFPSFLRASTDTLHAQTIDEFHNWC